MPETAWAQCKDRMNDFRKRFGLRQCLQDAGSGETGDATMFISVWCPLVSVVSGAWPLGCIASDKSDHWLQNAI